jgi:DNA-binding NarL/FixJ family response regulator
VGSAEQADARTRPPRAGRRAAETGWTKIGAGPDVNTETGREDARVQWRILIVDDHPGFRTWARRLLSSDGFDVVAEAPDGASAIRAIEAFHPQVVLLDVQLPDVSGFDLAARVARLTDRPAVVLTSALDLSDHGGRVQSSGAAGFIAKSELTGVRLTALLRQDG